MMTYGLVMELAKMQKALGLIPSTISKGYFKTILTIIY
jgi:hypothetical protein